MNAKTLSLGAALLAAGAALAHGLTTPLIDPAGLKQELLKRRGKPIVVVFWNVASASDLAALAKLKAKGVEVVTVAVEDKNRAAGALTRLGDAPGTFLNKSGEDFHPDYVRFLEPKLSDMDGAFLPRTYVVGRDGKVLRTLEGKGGPARALTLIK